MVPDMRVSDIGRSADRYGLSRQTALRVARDLASEGFLSRRKGAGHRRAYQPGPVVKRIFAGLNGLFPESSEAFQVPPEIPESSEGGGESSLDLVAFRAYFQDLAKDLSPRACAALALALGFDMYSSRVHDEFGFKLDSGIRFLKSQGCAA